MPCRVMHEMYPSSLGAMGSNSNDHHLHPLAPQQPWCHKCTNYGQKKLQKVIFLDNKSLGSRIVGQSWVKKKPNLRKSMNLFYFDVKKTPNMTKIKNVKFDTKIKKRIIFRYYFDSISTFRYTSNRMFSKKKKLPGYQVTRSANKCLAIQCL